MCNNITTIATSFWFHLFSKPIHFGQFFWHLVLSLLSSHPRFGDGTGRTGTWTVEEGQACYQAPTIRTCCLPFLGFGGKTGLRWGDAKIYGIFFWAGWGGGVDPCFCIFFRIWEQFFFLVWVFFCLTLDEFRVVFFWSWSHAVILGVGEQISTWEIFDQGRHSLMRLRRYRWWCAEKHRDPRPRWWWALCAQWKKSGLDLEKDKFLMRYF